MIIDPNRTELYSSSMPGAVEFWSSQPTVVHNKRGKQRKHRGKPGALVFRCIHHLDHILKHAISMRVSHLEKLCNTWPNSLAMLSVTESSKVTIIFSNAVTQFNNNRCSVSQFCCWMHFKLKLAKGTLPCDSFDTPWICTLSSFYNFTEEKNRIIALILDTLHMTSF